MDRYFEKILEGALLALIVFTPLAFGSVLPWAFKAVESVIFLLIFLRSVKAVREGRFTYVKTPLLYFLPAVAALVALQVVPMPMAAVEAMSKGRGLMRAAAGLKGGWDTISVLPWAAREQGLFFISVLALFFLIINHPPSSGSARRRVFTALGMGGLLAALAFVQRGIYIRDWFLPFVNKNHYAGYMEILIPMALSFMLFELFGAEGGPGLKDTILKVFSGAGGAKGILMGFLAAGMVSALLLTKSRGAVLGLLASLCVMAALYSTDKKRLALFALASAALLSLGLGWVGQEKVIRNMGTLALPSRDQPTVARMEIWRGAAGIIEDFPVAGVGLGGYETVSPLYKDVKYGGFNFSQPESDVLYVLAECGAIGLLLAAAFGVTLLAVILGRYFKRRDTFARTVGMGAICGLVALTVHGFVETNFHMPANLLLVTIMVATGYAAVDSRSRRGSGADGRNPAEKRKVELDTAPSRGAVAACAVLSFALGAYALCGSAASLLYRSALKDEVRITASKTPDTEDYQRALDKLARASLLDPGCSRYSFEQGRIYLTLAEYRAKGPDADSARGSYEAALGSIRESLKNNPYSSFGHFLAGRVLEHGLGRREAGEKEYAAAETLNPVSPFLMGYLASYNRGATGPPTQAARPAGPPVSARDRTLALRPGIGGYTAKVGDMVVWSAAVTPPDDRLEYRFRGWYFGKGWVVERPFSPDIAWVWDTSGAVPGKYRMMIWARTVGDKGVGEWRAADRTFELKARY